MPWTLDPAAPPAAELHRLLLAQGQRAAEALAGPDLDRGVHEARKASKRARALLRSARRALPFSVYRAELTRFRDAARSIAASRDAAVRLQTFDLFAAGRWPEVRRALVDAARAAHLPGAVDAAREAFARPPSLPDTLDREAWIAGIADRYRAGRRARPEATTAAPEDFHAWRRATKDHLYLLQLLRPLWPPVLDALADATDALQERLGLHQDLHVLREWLSATGLGDAELARRLGRRAADLRRTTLREGQRVYSLPAPAWEGWIRRLWPPGPA